MITGDYYNAGDATWSKTQACQNLLHRLNVTEYQLPKARVIAELIRMPVLTYIEPPFHCDYGYNIGCGDNVYFNVNALLDCAQ
jgi:maltose O-acetyltransferase